MNIRAILLFGLLAAATVHANDSRTWTSSDGSATIEARFFKRVGEQITLILPNGRSQVVQAEYLSQADRDWIAQNTENPESTPALGATAPSASASAPIPAALDGNLIDDRGREVKLATDDGSAPKYYLFYYSASWCGPCVGFTPELVRFHRQMKSRGASLEVILVPSDKSREAEIAYLKDHRMPWPGFDFDKLPNRAIPDNKYGYIPAMVLTDADGNRLLEVSKSLSRSDFLDQTKTLVAK